MEDNVHELRKRLRKEVKACRAAMLPTLRTEKSSLLCDRLVELLENLVVSRSDQMRPIKIGVYSAFEDEVRLDTFIRWAYEKGCIVSFPCMMHDARVLPGCCAQNMEFREVSYASYDMAQLELGTNGSSKSAGKESDMVSGAYFLTHPLRRFYIQDEELADNSYVPANELDMLVCPCVAFDEEGNRLGYGGGNYDRYLTQLRADTVVIAVAFEEQRVPAIPTDEYDVPLRFLSA